MPEKFKVEVVTPKGIVLDKEVEEVIAPGIMGEFGVLVGHTPMLTFIKPGILSYLEDGKFTRFAVGDGFCEVLKDAVTVIVEDAFSGDQVNAGDASAELKELEQELEGIDAAADPKSYLAVQNKIKLAQAKVSLAGGS
jgi:F-type H+-transporting ATPase subunit epsilon